MEDKPKTTLKELFSEIQQFVDIRQDANLFGKQRSSTMYSVNAINNKKNQPRDPPSPCFRCGGMHWAKDCDFINKMCHDCKLVGHKKGFCKNFAKKKMPKSEKKRRRANNVVIAASTTTDVAPINRIYRQVQISAPRYGSRC